jgi:hypothetical protein
MYVNRCCNPRRQKCDKEGEIFLKHERLDNRNRAYVECKNECKPVIIGATGTFSK